MISVHNPRDRWNARAFMREMRQVRRLRRAYDEPVAVFVGGDFNSGSWVACRARRAHLYSAGNRTCRGHVPIDQLLVDRRVRVTGYRAMSGSPVRRITDHPAVYRARFVVTG